MSDLLSELITAYSRLNYFDAHPFWNSKFLSSIDMHNFRRDNDYLAQILPPEQYWATYGYVAGKRPEYLEVLTEDNAFGVVTHKVGDVENVTRDLLDSCIEIDFLQEELGLARYEQLSVLDIGAGYGRFAHRFQALFPNSGVTCVDAIAQSTYLCQLYLKHRNVLGASVLGANVVPLHQLDKINGPFDLAVNIHSWSECSLSAINFWLDRAVDWNVKYLFVVPHTEECRSCLPSGPHGPSFIPAILTHGFKQVVMRRKYPASVESACIYPLTYFLFKR